MLSNIRRVPSPVIWFYLLLIHAALAVALTNAYRVKAKSSPSGSSDHIQRMKRYHQWIDANVPDQSAIFIGDSLTQGLSTASISRNPTNFGIGGQTSGELLDSIPSYNSLARARTIYLQIGINDILEQRFEGLPERLKVIADRLPSDAELIWTNIMPAAVDVVQQQAILAANEQIKASCAKRARCRYVDSWQFMADANGQAISKYFLSDGIHLSQAGYGKWIAALRGDT